MSKETTTQTASADSGVIAKLKKHKAAHSGNGEFTLPETGVKVTFPKFQNHGQWIKAQRLAKRDSYKAQSIYLVNVCQFEGENLTLQEFSDLIPATDVFELMAEVMGDEEDGRDRSVRCWRFLHKSR